jgi:hypothetical protein
MTHLALQGKCRASAGRGWQLAVGSWQLAVGSWQWQWAVGSWQSSVVSGCGEKLRFLAREAECRRVTFKTEVAGERTDN